ncbi:MAG: 16S rRNA (uracil(1498)-N(3))-methyltransferase [Rhodospirillales bacterium]
MAGLRAAEEGCAGHADRAQATELGAERLLVLTRFTHVERLNIERLRARAVEAAEQCGRLTVPAIAERPCPLPALLAQWPPSAAAAVRRRARQRPPGRETLVSASSGPAPGLLIGPEGRIQRRRGAGS